MRFVIATAAIVVLSSSAMGPMRACKTGQSKHCVTNKLPTSMLVAEWASRVAELNGYPGPLHAIELASDLRLSPEQVAKLKALFEAMKAETIPLGASLISQERDLNDDFANRKITLAGLEAATHKIGATQAAL